VFNIIIPLGYALRWVMLQDNICIGNFEIGVIHIYNHMVNKQSQHPYKCQFCKRKFKSKKALFAHLRFCPVRPKNIRKKLAEKSKKLKEQDLYLGEEYY